MLFSFLKKKHVTSIIVLFSLVALLTTGFFFWDDDRDNPAPKLTDPPDSKASADSTAITNHHAIPTQKLVATIPKPTQNVPKPTTFEALTEQYEAYILKTTDAQRVRVESTSAESRGYVAFMARPEGFDRGIPTVMEELAQIYLDTFKDAPAITLSLVIGGGIKGQMTFLRDEDGAAVLPEHHGARTLE